MRTEKVVLFLILGLAAFLLFYRLSELMPFFADVAWYYIAARDMLLTGAVPLVGIPSSHPWLHQGAAWTYFLAGSFAATQFNPLVPGYLVATIGIFTVWLIYFLGKKMFSAGVGLFAAVLYATSPLILIHTRMPYHTNPISLLSMLFLFSLYKWVIGNKYCFPLCIFLLATLYNFEIATLPFLATLCLFLGYGIWKKKEYAMKLYDKKIVLYSFLGWLIPMLPMLLHDITHGFPQTLKVILWIGYRIARVFGFPDIHAGETFPAGAPFLPFTTEKVQQLIFLPNEFIAILLFLGSVSFVGYLVYKTFKKKKSDAALLVVFITFLVSTIFYIALRTASDAYWPMFFPSVILLLAVSFEELRNKKNLQIVILLLVGLIAGFNSYTMIQKQYLMQANGYGPTFTQRQIATDEIIAQAKGQKYTIIGQGPGSHFRSYIMPYEYLTWWKGQGPSYDKNSLKIGMSESLERIIIKQLENAK